MQIQKRSLPMYTLFNCLTLGVYGFIVGMQIDKEINALCKGDGEQPKLSYAGAVMIRGISTFLGLVTGLIVGLVYTNKMDPFDLGSYIPGMGDAKTIEIFISILCFGIIFTLFGSVISGLYLNYWWYKQANRLKLNAHRYNLHVKESGTDTFLLRTVLNVLFIPITVVLLTLSFLIPGGIAWLITLGDSTGAYVAAVVIVTIFAIPFMLFGSELTTGSLFSFFFITKNLNRYADVYRNGAKPFDPMGYEYYPSLSNHYIRSLPPIVNGTSAVARPAEVPNYNVHHDEPDTSPLDHNSAIGTLKGLSGSCSGYEFTLTAGEEIIIGKDAKLASVVIDPAYKEISRKHVGISYDAMQDVYHVTDYSSNGTWANGQKLAPGVSTIQGHGTILKLANDKNTFRLA